MFGCAKLIKKNNPRKHLAKKKEKRLDVSQRSRFDNLNYYSKYTTYEKIITNY